MSLRYLQRVFVILLGLSGLFWVGCRTMPGLAGDEVPTQRPEFANLLDAVVRIDVRERTFQNGRKQAVSGVGSGVILSDEGYIVTNAHVVSDKAIDISVTLASLERVEAQFVGWDHWTDLALIQLDMEEVERRGLTFATASFGPSDTLFPGQTVFAVGTPNGLTRTVSRGIISNTNRYFEGVDGVRGYETGFFNTWLQTDAAINPGNSGGPLVAANGEVIGINTRAYLGANNLGFAVPSSTARVVVKELLEHGEVTRSYIGISAGPLQDLETFFDIGANQGMLVASVDPGSPADHAGLRAGDLLLALDGESLDGRFPEQLPPIRNTIASYPVGAELDFLVRRGSETFPVVVTTEKLESRVGEEWAFEEWGLTVRVVSRAYAREQRLASESGFVVLGVQRAFPADEARLQPGDVILKINRETVETLEEFQEIYEKSLEEREPLLMEVSRNHSVSLLILNP